MVTLLEFLKRSTSSMARHRKFSARAAVEVMLPREFRGPGTKLRAKRAHDFLEHALKIGLKCFSEPFAMSKS